MSDPTGSESFNEGLRVRRSVLGDKYVDAALAGATEFSKPMQQLVTEYCWGTIWTRDGLPLKTRSLLNLAILAVLNRPQEFASHVRGAVKNGASPQEIQEVLLQTAVYAGVPCGIEAFRIASTVLRDLESQGGDADDQVTQAAES